MNKSKSKIRPATADELQAASGEFDRQDCMPRFDLAPVAEQRRHDRALAQARRKRGRPAIGKGAERIQITLERTLLAEADSAARKEHISRSELISRGLRLALAL